MALLPTLGVEQKAAIRGCLDAMEEGRGRPFPARRSSSGRS